METHNDIDVRERDNEFSPKKFIMQAKSLAGYVFSRWLIIITVALLLGIAGAVYSYFKKPIYTAEITFALDEEATQNAQNAFVTSGEELGLGPLSIDASGAFFGRMTNIAELLQSRLIIENVLRDTIRINNHRLVFADFFLDSLDYRKKWMKAPAYDHLDFRSAKDTLIQNAIIANIYETLSKQNIKVDKKGKETTIVSVTCITENELFSKCFLEALLTAVTNYYVDIKTQRAKSNLVFIEHRMDSVKAVYYDALTGKASFTDAHTNPSRQIGIVSIDKQQTELQILKSAYIDLSRSMEVAKMALIRVTPLIQYLDKPVLPLKKTSSGIMKWFLVCFFAGSFMMIVFFTIRKIIKTIMQY